MLLPLPSRPVRMFPSPQVGSGRGGRYVGVRRALGFHPLKSGRDSKDQYELDLHVASFHPLKSGRDSKDQYELDLHVASFHPLKSGRDEVALVAFECEREFPSPQVGSGPCRRRGYSSVGKSFPSPQVGSGLPRVRDINYLAQKCFHPLKSGRDTLHTTLHTTLHKSFHPLKSGRDKRAPPPPYRRSRFHPLKSGRDSLFTREGTYPKISFHPLKSGRDLLLQCVAQTL